jgi:hypothetical protein
VVFGVEGQADYTGLTVPHGIRLEVEAKAPGKKAARYVSPGVLDPLPRKKTKTEEAQLRFGRMVVRNGGIYIYADSLSDACAQLNETLRARGIEPREDWGT